MRVFAVATSVVSRGRRLNLLYDLTRRNLKDSSIPQAPYAKFYGFLKIALSRLRRRPFLPVRRLNLEYFATRQNVVGDVPFCEIGDLEGSHRAYFDHLILLQIVTKDGE